VDLTARGHFPHTLELQVCTAPLSHAGASPLVASHSLSCPSQCLSLYKPRAFLAGFLLFLDFLTLEDRTDPLSWNVSKGLPLDAALYPRRAQISYLLSCWHVLMLRERPSYPDLLQQIKHGSIIWTADKNPIHGMAPSSISLEEKIKSLLSMGKVIITVFWDSEWVMPVDVMPWGETINSDDYIRMLTELRRSLKQVWPRNNPSEVLLQHDNAKPHTSLKTWETTTKFGQCSPSIPHPWSSILKISTYLEPLTMQFAVQSVRLMMMWFTQWKPGYMSRTQHGTNKAYTLVPCWCRL
jgi:hypothetical protein